MRSPRHGETLRAMCNLYSITKGQQAIRDLASACATSRATCRCCPASFPTIPLRSSAPRWTASVNSRWRAGACRRRSSPSKGRKSDAGVTNIRNVASPHWRRWLGVESRCVVPFTSFAEHEVLPDGSRPPVWFALDESRRLAFFAGIWTRWTSVRKVKEGKTTNDLFAFLTTEPNAVVAPIHPKAMPVILTRPDEIESLACGADCGSLEAATAAARRRASDRRAGIERGWGANALD